MFWYALGTAFALTWTGALVWAGLIAGRKQDRQTRDELAGAKLVKVQGAGEGFKSAA